MDQKFVSQEEFQSYEKNRMASAGGGGGSSSVFRDPNHIKFKVIMWSIKNSQTQKQHDDQENLANNFCLCCPHPENPRNIINKFCSWLWFFCLTWTLPLKENLYEKIQENCCKRGSTLHTIPKDQFLSKNSIFTSLYLKINFDNFFEGKISKKYRNWFFGQKNARLEQCVDQCVCTSERCKKRSSVS